ncbi:MAG TPA: PQQ-binding-like beta-propeller repeat protein, partial [Bryobacteraceae bacterium]|nr:PQQ-binding-like beta-propeller repeat protein [Bryobacteraceae bacterium]
MHRYLILALAVALLTGFQKSPDGEWPAYGRDPGGQRFSPLSMINRENVQSLKIAWTFRSGDTYQPKFGRPTAFEATPLYVDGVLYIGTPLGRVIALDPVSGHEIWSYDGKVPKDKGYGDYANRGVSYWKPASGKPRVFIATVDARL